MRLEKSVSRNFHSESFTISNGHLSVKIQAVVCDGDTLGHPCCAVHDCKLPLVTHRQRFCYQHRHLDLQCSVIGCSAQCAKERRTCGDTQHQALEDAYFRKGKAIFVLRDRLKKAGVSVPADTLDVPPEDDDEVLVETDLACAGKPEEGNRKLRAYFGRRRTHNEQLIMRPCGVILSRATFFGSEAVSAVNVSSLC